MLKQAYNPSRDRPNCRMVWIHGPPGCGKSHAARITLPNQLQLRPVIKNSIDAWWPSNCVESDVVIIEDVDFSFDKKVGLENFKIWGDKYSFNAPFKGGNALISPALLIVTSNYSLEELIESRNADVRLCEAITRRTVLRFELDAQNGGRCDQNVLDDMNEKIYKYYEN